MSNALPLWLLVLTAIPTFVLNGCNIWGPYNNPYDSYGTNYHAIISTVAGNGVGGYGGDLGPATLANLSSPWAVALDSAGNLYIADSANCCIRKVNKSTGIITTVAGNTTAGFSGDSGPAISAELSDPVGIALDSAGNLFIADNNNNRIRKVTAGTGIITTVAGIGTGGYNGDGVPATTAELNNPTGIALDSAGNLYIVDASNNRIREVNIGTGIISTTAGTGTGGYNGDYVLATSAELNNPNGLAFDSAGNLYIAEYFNNRVRKVDTGGIITTVTGNGTGSYNGDSIAATTAELFNPTGVALDSSGNLYIADQANHRIREVNNGTGLITTVAGTGTGAYNGDDITATLAELNSPVGIALDSSDKLYIADRNNNRIRMLH
jgi:trimeric autotransporter adhesin